MGVQYTIILFLLAIGYASAGFLNAVHLAIMPRGEDENGHFILYFDTFLSTAWSIIICLFAGPYLVLKNALRFWTKGQLPTAAFAFFALISMFWSLCSGVIFFEVATSLGILSV